jgi:diguanylate cyclase (GGDEF)-like protein/PAS domain S-box-containing protein
MYPISAEGAGIPFKNDTVGDAAAASDYDAQRLAEIAAQFGRWRINVADRTIRWTEGVASIFGVAMPDRGLMPLDEHLRFYHPDERDAVRTRIEAVIHGTEPSLQGTYNGQARIVRPDGAERTVIIRGVPKRDASGAVTAIVGILLDVTEQAWMQEKLRETSELLRTTLENMDQGLILYGPDMRVRLHNRRARELLDLPESVLCEGSPYDVINAYQVARGEYQTSPDSLMGALDAADLASLPDVYERARPNGTSLEVRVVRLQDGGYVRTYSDTTRRAESERALLASEARLRASEDRLAHALDSGNDGLWDWNLVTGEAWFSDRWFRMIGYERGELRPNLELWPQVAHPEDGERAVSAMRDHLRGLTATYECEYRLLTKSGGQIWVLTRGKVVGRDASGRALRVVGTQIDITRRKEAEQQVAHMATHDGLTGLPNRALFRDRLEQAFAASRRHGDGFALLVCDLDRFKVVNDTLGHLAGDAVLQVVAERLRGAVRDGDTVARLGGDEFAIIVSRLDGSQSAGVVARRAIQSMEQPIELDGRRMSVGISIGIALAPQDGFDGQSLFNHADMALYIAKTATHSECCFYDPSMSTMVAVQGEREQTLREALWRDEFTLHYQPIVCAADEAVSGFEALLRWQNPTRGLIPPSEFIPLAEETGLIVALGEWALRAACREAVSWPDDLRVAVNVSAVQFQQPGLEQAILGALLTSGLAPHRLELEITESVLMRDSEAVIACLHRLKALGVRIALDDFGTGFSSLSYLRRFPFDKIKIDRTFIRDIADPDTASIVRAIVGIGSRRGAIITAEGVETQDQSEKVQQEGCTEMQGFLYSKPVTASDALSFIRTHRSRHAA